MIAQMDPAHVSVDLRESERSEGAGAGYFGLTTRSERPHVLIPRERRYATRQGT
jgi:hypothetical protein